MYFVLTFILFSSFYLTDGFLSLKYHAYQHVLEEMEKRATSLNVSSITTQWIQQKVDNFNLADTREWKMKYFQNLDRWQPGGPIIIYIGGESPALTTFLVAGLAYDLAVETNGALFSSEHRYYGDSKPFHQLTTENLKYLSSQQALADVANLIKYIKSSSKYRTSKVVVIGGSYAGNLATWMKLLYPNLIDAAVASSAPIVAKANFFEYLETVSDDFTKYGTSGCIEAISQKFHRYVDLLKTETGIQQLKREENLCDQTNFNLMENRQFFFLSMSLPFGHVALTGDLNKIQEKCMYQNSIDNEFATCDLLDLKYYIITMEKNENAAKSWLYQTCTEFGYFVTTTSQQTTFTDNIHVDLSYKICAGVFGSDFDSRRVEDGVKNTNAMYGGRIPNVTHVVFVNGELDPWHRLGVTEDLSLEAPAIMISRASHCNDLYPSYYTDSPELKGARRYIKDLIKKWIGIEKLDTKTIGL